MAEPGVGIDCIRLIVEILTDAGVTPPFRFPAYDTAEGLHDRSDRMKEGFSRCTFSTVASKQTPEFGDVAVFRTGRMSGHCAFVLDGQIAHSLARQHVVVSDYRIYRPAVDCLIRLEAVGLREQPSTLWQSSQG